MLGEDLFIMEKKFKVSQVRDLLNQVHNEKITFSRFVEILNESLSVATKSRKELKLEVMMRISHPEEYYKNAIKSRGIVKVEELTHVEISIEKAAMLSIEADAILDFWETIQESDLGNNIKAYADKKQIANILVNHKQMLLDYIYEFAAMYGQYYHAKDADVILEKVGEKLELPEEFLKRFDF